MEMTGPDARPCRQEEVTIMGARATTFPIEHIAVSVYRIPTASPEADGTYQWDATTLVVAEAAAGGKRSLGYTYADTATGRLIQDMLAEVVTGRDAMDVPGCWLAMVGAIRNLGRPGISSMAIAAVDVALWDLKARLLDLSLVALLGAARDAAPVYGSGGFTTYTDDHLKRQLSGWVAEGIPRVKMKIGTHPERDLDRVRAARDAIGPQAQLMVDANGAYHEKQALEKARAFRDYGVVWFEEPLPSDDLAGLHLLRDQGPPGMVIAAGEYGYDLVYFRRMLEAHAVDVLQADASRCAGITGFLRAATLAASHNLPLSPHCAPTLHVAPACAIEKLWPIEYFYDHARIEHMLFDGVLTPVDGALHPDRARPGMGVELKRSDAERFAV